MRSRKVRRWGGPQRTPSRSAALHLGRIFPLTRFPQNRLATGTFNSLRPRARDSATIPNPPLASPFAEPWAVIFSRGTTSPQARLSRCDPGTVPAPKKVGPSLRAPRVHGLRSPWFALFTASPHVARCRAESFGQSGDVRRVASLAKIPRGGKLRGRMSLFWRSSEFVSSALSRCDAAMSLSAL
jgi:hypothetical protein